MKPLHTTFLLLEITRKRTFIAGCIRYARRCIREGDFRFATTEIQRALATRERIEQMLSNWNARTWQGGEA